MSASMSRICVLTVCTFRLEIATATQQRELLIVLRKQKIFCLLQQLKCEAELTVKHFEFGTTTKQKHQDAATPPKMCEG